jgi:hypothetical protein
MRKNYFPTFQTVQLTQSLVPTVENVSSTGVKPYLTLDQVGSILGVSPDSIMRRFANLPGVIDLGSPETMHKRRKRLIRIPYSTLNSYIANQQVSKRK